MGLWTMIFGIVAMVFIYKSIEVYCKSEKCKDCDCASGITQEDIDNDLKK